MMENRDYLEAAANIVYEQITENPFLRIEVEPSVADFMGMVDEDDAITIQELDEGWVGVDENGVCVAG